MNIEILVKKAKQGDKEALVQLLMTQKKDFYKLAYLYMKNEHDALDAMQDTIVILYENIHKLKNADAFYSWSKTILVNCCKKLLKENKKIVSLDHIKEDFSEECFDKKDEQIVLKKHLANLKEKYQEVLKLHYFLDLDNETIAKIINIPVGTVKSRIFNGLKKLKESLGGDE
ncbi:sigma-70 family RNA polymerase sigma factor [Clostridium sp. P21]|uniref:Sigma-70 family RNA polymerase sigma factor n=1 Tax=Clostridium muellerianum TaxID=2716538 RepID=A0A7Y0HNB3_9CLOT|nr:sigma-70 family RNA polymerase sigma factor [Clostridium muellerianum]NMM62985.1 sigma-70 family RNA polymerase sigma factor [Clostridium muellerianum]